MKFDKVGEASKVLILKQPRLNTQTQEDSEANIILYKEEDDDEQVDMMKMMNKETNVGKILSKLTT